MSTNELTAGSLAGPRVLVTAPTDGAQTHAWPFPSDAPWSLRRLSLAYVEWAVSKTAGDKKRAAEMLGIDVSTL